MKRFILLCVLSTLFFSCKKDKICPTGYTGDDCDQQITPTNVILKSIRVSKFPQTDGGAGWDFTSGPDIYLVISQNNQIVFENRSSYIENATQGVNFNVQFTLPNPTGIYTIDIYDNDGLDNDDYIGGIIAPIYSNLTGFPQTVVLDCNSCPVSYSIPVGYTF